MDNQAIMRVLDNRRNQIEAKGLEPRKPFGVDQDEAIKVMSSIADRKFEQELINEDKEVTPQNLAHKKQCTFGILEKRVIL